MPSLIAALRAPARHCREDREPRRRRRRCRSRCSSTTIRSPTTTSSSASASLSITTQQQPSPDVKKKATDLLIDERLQMQQARQARRHPRRRRRDARSSTDMAKKNNLTVDGLTQPRSARSASTSRRSRIASGPSSPGKMSVRQKFRRDVADRRRRRRQGAVRPEAARAAGAAAGATALQLRQVKFEIPAGADQKTIASQTRRRGGAARAIRHLRQRRRSHQGRRRRERQVSRGPAARPRWRSPHDCW